MAHMDEIAGWQMKLHTAEEKIKELETRIRELENYNKK
jgi:hypothetical protein